MGRLRRCGFLMALALPCGMATGDEPIAGADLTIDFRTVAAAAPQPLPAAGLATAQELEAFVDGFVGGAFEANQTAGLTIAVVKDGGLFFSSR